MASADAIPLAVKNQAYRVYGCVKNVTTGKVITGGLTGLAGSISKDGGSFASTTSAPAEIGTTGFFSLDLTATEMNANAVSIKVSATNTNAVDVCFVIPTYDLTRSTTNAWNQSVVRIEQLWAQVHGRQTCTYQIGQTSVSILDPVTNSPWLTGSLSIGATGQRGKLG